MALAADQEDVGLTSPDPLWHPHGLSMFDPSPPGPQCDDDILPKAAHTLGNLLSAAAGTCRGLCQARLGCVTPLPSSTHEFLLRTLHWLISVRHAPCWVMPKALMCLLHPMQFRTHFSM